MKEGVQKCFWFFFLKGIVTWAKWVKPLLWKKVDSSFLGVGCRLTTHKSTHTQNTQPTLRAALNTQPTRHTPAHPVDRRQSTMFPSLDSHSILLQDRVWRKREVEDLG